jgi:hypothetical protein
MTGSMLRDCLKNPALAKYERFCMGRSALRLLVVA